MVPEAAWVVALIVLGTAGFAASRSAPSGAPATVIPAALPITGAPDAGSVRYGRDVRRILSDRCFQCHGSDPNTRAANLRLDVREEAVADRKGGAAIVPGDAAGSQLWRRINSHDALDVMPPPSAAKRPINDAEKAVIKRWIDEGAAYEPHWAFQPPAAPPAPVSEGDRWSKNDLDRFVLATMRSRGVAPSPEADRATLLRRVTHDLTGLPPTTEELRAFVADTSEDAYERVVDRLLTTEPYRTRVAERLASTWLDQARYADTSGIHMDAGRQIWPWRDWVLRAFRDNMPYDRFLREQLAGDLIPDATTDQLVASGFNRNHVTTDEGGAIAEEYLVEYAVDRVATTSSVFLGLTMGCARCHDHKYDPITQDDFYGMYAFFNSIEEPGLYSQLPDPTRAFEPFISVPAPEQTEVIERLKATIKRYTEQMDGALPGETEALGAHLAGVRAGAGWVRPRITGATASDASTKLEAGADGFVTASGPVPAIDEYTVTLAEVPAGANTVLIEIAGADDAAAAGRSPNGNGVVTGAVIERLGADGAADRVPLVWAWADHAQKNGDFEATGVLDGSAGSGWAFGAHEEPGKRLLLLTSQKPFAGASGSARLTLSFRSKYTQHSVARFRVSVGATSDTGAASLPVAMGRWQMAGPFTASSFDALYDTAFGPETTPPEDNATVFAGDRRWGFNERLVDGAIVPLNDGASATYVGRAVWSPSEREIELSLGSDDGIRVFVNGEGVFTKKIDRGPTMDSERVKVRLRAGENSIVLKIINTGGPSAYYFRAIEGASVMAPELVGAVVPEDATTANHSERVARAWRRTFPEYAKIETARTASEAELAKLEAAMPKSMVMKELATPRETFVLTRGQYDRPDRSRPVQRAVPRALGALPADVPRDRLALAGWMTAPENPLVARVAVNRMFELVFGQGIVRTSDDFGYQGEWPTHPEMLDALAVGFREGGWDVRALLRLMVTSATYRQSSRVREDLSESDPDNRLLARYPRRRMSAEQIRDQALYVSGLLVEKLGGPSVKPYQPDGLWQEVAMPQSNTREYQRGMGEELHRRSLYTYWKRACPPPSLQTFDAPTREACMIRRPSTNTPLQALVLWNDEQYLEAARLLAARTLSEPGDDDARLAALVRRCASRELEAAELVLLREALADFRSRYTGSPEDAKKLLTVGVVPAPDSIPAPELAAWTMVASSVLNFHETITQD